MAICPEEKKYYGITVDCLRNNAYKFVWAFKIDKDRAKREGYDSQSVHGGVELVRNIRGVHIARATLYFLLLWGSHVLAWPKSSYMPVL